MKRVFLTLVVGIVCIGIVNTFAATAPVPANSTIKGLIVEGSKIYSLSTLKSDRHKYSIQTLDTITKVTSEVTNGVNYGTCHISLLKAGTILFWTTSILDQIKIIENGVVTKTGLIPSEIDDVNSWQVAYSQSTTGEPIVMSWGASSTDPSSYKVKAKKISSSTLKPTDSTTISITGIVQSAWSNGNEIYILTKDAKLHKFVNGIEASGWPISIPGIADGGELRVIGERAYVLSNDKKLTAVKTNTGSIINTIPVEIIGTLAPSSLTDIQDGKIVSYDQDLNKILEVTTEKNKPVSDVVINNGKPIIADDTQITTTPGSSNNNGNNNNNTTSVDEVCFDKFPGKTPVQIINMSGIVVRTGTIEDISYENLYGIYFVRTGNSSKKISLK